MNKSLIEVKNLVFYYPNKRALKDVSFSIRESSITALVGPNGAGKTTLMRCIAALEEPRSGSIYMNGEDIYHDPRSTHKNIGYLSDFFGLYENLTVRQCLHYAAMSHGIVKDNYEEIINYYANELQLADRLDIKTTSLSRGQRQRLAIAQAIIHEPKFLILDEPASGLDPEARQSLALLFKRLRDRGMTILVSSHILSELEEYSTDILIIKDGNVVEHKSLTISEPRRLFELKTITENNKMFEILSNTEEVTDLSIDGNVSTFMFSSDVFLHHKLLKNLIENNIQVYYFAEQHNNLQETYLRTVKGISPL
jgi:ABC-2 type transport system ATP-binding protein